MRHAREDYERFQDPAGLIPVEEPVFLIRGQDLTAPDTLRYWAAHAHRLGAANDMVLKVLNHARAMEEWQRTVASKTPDL